MSPSIQEGDIEIFLPPGQVNRDVLKSSETVFYNPEMALNRDINVLMTDVAVDQLISKKGFDRKTIEYIDAFSATGIRGLRIAKDVGISVILNDRKQEAFDTIKKNIEHNDLKLNAAAYKIDANVLLHSRNAAFVDIDPFGSPTAFLDAAASCASFYLGITATDTAPLCGAHLKSGMRKYASVPLNNEFHSEMGLRILLGSIARSMAKYEKGMKVLLSHATRHYVRCYVQVLRGPARADKTMEEIGYLAWCPICGTRETKKGLAVFMDPKCTECHHMRKISGPLWLGVTKDTSVCQSAFLSIKKFSLSRPKDAEKLLSACIEELDIPFFYDQHKLCEELGISATSMNAFLEKIKEKGYPASRTHYSGTSFKTKAPLAVIKNVLKE